MRTFDENSCAISITSPRSLSPLRTQHVWWDHREKSRRASTLWDCRGKSHLAELSPANGTQSERGEKLKHVIVVAEYTTSKMDVICNNYILLNVSFFSLCFLFICGIHVALSFPWKLYKLCFNTGNKLLFNVHVGCGWRTGQWCNIQQHLKAGIRDF